MLRAALKEDNKSNTSIEKLSQRERDCKTLTVCLGKETNNKGHKKGIFQTKMTGKIVLILAFHTHHKARVKGKLMKDGGIENNE